MLVSRFPALEALQCTLRTCNSFCNAFGCSCRFENYTLRCIAMHCKNSAFCIVRHKYTYLHATKYCILCETQKHKPKPHFLASTLYALFALNWRISNPACSGVFVFLCSCCIEHVYPALLQTAFYSCKNCIYSLLG